MEEHAVMGKKRDDNQCELSACDRKKCYVLFSVVAV